MLTLESMLGLLLGPIALSMWMVAVFVPLFAARKVSWLRIALDPRRVTSGVVATVLFGAVVFAVAFRFDPLSLLLGAIITAPLATLLVLPIAFLLIRLRRGTALYLIFALFICLFAADAWNEWTMRDYFDFETRLVRTIPELGILALLAGGAFSAGARLPLLRAKMS